MRRLMFYSGDVGKTVAVVGNCTRSLCKKLPYGRCSKLRDRLG